MTLSRVTRARALLAIAFLALGIVFLGNQRQASAATIDSSLTSEGRMACIVYTGSTGIRDFSFPAFTYQDHCPGEQLPPSSKQCSNGIDDDTDGLTDAQDPACHTDGNASNTSSYNPSLDNEALSVPQCKDGIDNDGDGKKDYLADPGCASLTDTDEADAPLPPPPPACSNDADDDADTFTDENDPNCHTDGNPSNAASYDASRTSESGTLPVCWNGIDDDNDGKKDFPLDLGCTSAIDTEEADNNSSTPPAPQCSNGTDDDGDSFIDTNDPNCHTDGDSHNAASYDPNRTENAALPACADGIDNDNDNLIDLADPGCSSRSDTDESNSSGGSTPANTGGGSRGGGGGGGSAIATQLFSVGTVLGASTSTPPAVSPTESCDQYLTSFIRAGRINDSEQVKRLQYVLREFEGTTSIEVNGVYDSATLAAVHAFQTKYASEILTPWGIGESTGFVYLTTRKKINEIYCRGTNQFPLTPEEQKVIEQTREALSVQTTLAVPTSQTEVVTPKPPSETATGTEDAGTTPMSQKSFWERIRNLFKTRESE